MPDPPSEPSLTTELLELADAKAHEVPGRLRRLTEHSLRMPGIEAGGVLVATPQGQFRDVIASGPTVDRLEQLQIEHEEGPCRDTLRTGKPLADLPLPHPHCRARWPHFTPSALSEGFTAVTALLVRHHGHTFGALNLFHQHRRPHPATIRACQSLADAAALGLAHQRALRELRERNARLETALDSRVLIEQAKGILAERLRLQPDEAFDRMRRHARAHQRKLTDLAHQIIHDPADAGPFARPADG
jgi:GAF domain-containing protein